MTILHIDSSIQGPGSISRRLTAAIVAALATPSGEPVVYRDVSVASGALDRCVDEFLAADVIVIGAPMYNLGVPSGLKSWIDAIAVPRKTFRYTADGPCGLAGGRRVIVAYASGGFHNGSEQDFVEPYLRAVFRMLGVADVDVVRAEGVNVSADHRARTLAAAERTIAEIVMRVADERRRAA